MLLLLLYQRHITQPQYSESFQHKSPNKLSVNQPLYVDSRNYTFLLYDCSSCNTLYDTGNHSYKSAIPCTHPGRLKQLHPHLAYKEHLLDKIQQIIDRSRVAEENGLEVIYDRA